MKYMRFSSLIRIAIVAIVVITAGSAHAKNHLWRFTEAFSNVSGNVQFIEMFVFDPAGTGETFLAGAELASVANTFIFPNRLPPEENTFNRWILIATQDFADLPGAPVPDFIMPANFFDPAGDELRYDDVLDIFLLPSGQVPTDGLHSLLTDLSTPVNSPTNFAGVMGSVGAVATVPGLQTGGVIALTLVAMLTLGVVRFRRTRDGLQPQ